MNQDKRGLALGGKAAAQPQRVGRPERTIDRDQDSREHGSVSPIHCWISTGDFWNLVLGGRVIDRRGGPGSSIGPDLRVGAEKGEEPKLP
jgi:hypothetical protein